MGDDRAPGLATRAHFLHLEYPDVAMVNYLLEGLPKGEGPGMVPASGGLPIADGVVRIPFHETPHASIIIPTLDRPTSLRRCFKSIAQQSLREFEVILVTKKGELARLRNEGASHAKGDILIFIDDDVYCPPEWLKEITLPFVEPSVAGASGPAVIREEFKAKRDIFRYPRIKRLYDWLFLEGKAHLPGHITRAGTWTTGACMESCSYEGGVDFAEACNMAFRRGAFVDCGGFDTRFGGIGDWSEPDLAFRIRAHTLGKIWFTPRAKLYHEPSTTGAYLSREQTGARLTNYLLFAGRWVDPCFRHTLYKLFLRGYFTWKEIRWHLSH